MVEPSATETDQLTEANRVRFRRYIEARDAGLTMVEARRFADSGTDIGLLRKCVKGGCSPQLTARILN